MSWRDRLREGSFRGAPFFVEAAEGEVGRRTVVHEYPGRDKPYAEDIGRLSRRIKLDAYVLGPDYFAARDALRDALERPGAGRLIHPYWGELRVSVDGAVRIRESTDEGGVARFSISFVEGGDTLGLTASVDTAARLERAAGVKQLASAAVARPLPAAQALQEALAKRVDVALASPEVRESLLDTLKGAAAALRRVRRLAYGALGTVDAVGAEIEAFAKDVASLVFLPKAFVARCMGVLAALFRSADAFRTPGGTTPDDAAASSGSSGAEPGARRLLTDVVLATLTTLNSYGTQSHPAASTEQRRQAQANDAEVRYAVHCAGAVAACDAVVSLPLESYEQAVRVRDVLADELEQLAAAAEDDGLYGSLVDLRAALIAHLSAVAGDRPRTTTWTPGVTLPALVCAHELYGDARRADELVARNGIRHPGFVQGGQPLEVLADG